MLTATILLVAEFCEPKKRHIVSVFKVIQELLAPSQKKGKNQFQQLREMLPNDHKAKWFAGAALNTSDQSMASVMSTTLSRLNAFLDSELEQLLCFDTEIIVDNTQLTIFGGFAPNNSSAEVLSKALGSRTVMSGSVSRSKNEPPQSLQMMECPLLTSDELKSLPKGEFVVMKTGVHPMRVKLKLFFKWGIQFDEKNPYTVPDNVGRTVEYAERKEITDGIMKKYRPNLPPPEDEKKTTGKKDTGKQSSKEKPRPKPSKGGTEMRPVLPSRRTPLNTQGGMSHEPT